MSVFVWVFRVTMGGIKVCKNEFGEVIVGEFVKIRVGDVCFRSRVCCGYK